MASSFQLLEKFDPENIGEQGRTGSNSVEIDDQLAFVVVIQLQCRQCVFTYPMQ